VYIATLGAEACGPSWICFRSWRAKSTSASTSTPLLDRSDTRIERWYYVGSGISREGESSAGSRLTFDHA